MTWVKLNVAGWLHGSIRYQLEPDERGVWADLIVMAGQCLHQGKICDNDGRAFPLQFIANQLNIPLELLERTLDKCSKEGRIKTSQGVIAIVNWSSYQSEYERQKPYRQKQTSPGIPPERDDEKLKQGWKDDGFGNWYKPTPAQEQSNKLVRQAVKQMVDR